MKHLSRLRLEIRTLIGQLEAFDKDLFLMELRDLVPVQGITQVTPPPYNGKRRGRPRIVPAWAVPGMPEDMDHPLNQALDQESREFRALDSSPQGNDGDTGKKIFSNLRPKEAISPRI